MNRSEPDRAQWRENLFHAILGSDLTLTSAEVAEKAGLPLEQGQRLWRALGFPEPGDGVAYGVADVEDGKSSGRLEAALDLAQAAAPGFEHLVIYAWRRHLAAAAARVEALGAADEELLSYTMTVGFADLSRFTTLSNALDDSSLATLVENFENRVTDIITSHGGRVIKALGDAVLFVCDDPQQGTRMSLDIVSQIWSRKELPDVRVGLATGSVISRMGDVYGPPVNLAARLSHVARSNRVLVDAATADALGDEFDMRALPPRPLRGFGNVSPITVTQRRGFRAR